MLLSLFNVIYMKVPGYLEGKFITTHAYNNRMLYDNEYIDIYYINVLGYIDFLFAFYPMICCFRLSSI